MNKNNLIITNELEYSSTLHLNKDSNDRSQLIYGSNDYETNYCVYAKFDVQDSTEEGYIVIKKIDFRIVNYKGILDIGFFDEPIFKKEKETGKGALINLKLIGNSTCLTKEIILNEEIKLPENGYSFLKVKKELIPLNGKSEDIQYEGGVFDKEFHYRDGNFVKKKTQYNDFLLSDSDEVIRNSSRKYSEEIAAAPGLRCVQGVNKIIF